MEDAEMHWETSFRTLAGRQDGLIGIDQLPDIDCHGEHWRRAKNSGRWQPLSRRVLLLGGSPVTDGTRARAALLDAGGGAVLHGGSALAWCGLRGFDLSTVHVVRRRGTTTAGCDLARVHRLRDLIPSDIVVVRGMPTVTALRAVWSEASRYAPSWSFDHAVKRIGRLCDDAHNVGLIRWGELHESVERLAGRGRAGSSIMRAVADRRRPGSSATESRNEDRLEDVLAEAGAQPLDRQVLVGGTRAVGRCDHRDPDRPLVVETNSLLFHSTPSDQQADEARYAELVAGGFCVVVVWERALWSASRSVVEAVADGRRRADRGEPAVVHTLGCPWPADPDRIVIGAPDRPYRG